MSQFHYLSLNTMLTFLFVTPLYVGPSPVPAGGQETALCRSVRDPTQPQRGRAQEQRARTRGRRTEKTEKRRGLFH